MNDIQEQMVQAIEQMKENSFSNQKQNADMGIIRLMWKYSDMWEKIKSWGSGFPIGYDFTIGYCGDIREYLMENYCNFLDIQDQKGVLCKEAAFGVKPGMQVEDIIGKWNNCYNQRRWTIPENAFLKAITGLSKEAMKILRTFYPEELTCSHAIAWDCISYSHVQYFQNYLKLFREELFEALKSEKLLYFIFWELKPNDTLAFVKKALDYDKDYFKAYHDEVGNNCLHYYLMRFELMLSSKDYSVPYQEIKSLLLEHGVDPDEKNIGGVSYNDLEPYTSGYLGFLMTQDMIYYSDLEETGGKECWDEIRTYGWVEWIRRYAARIPRKKWNWGIKAMVEELEIILENPEEKEEKEENFEYLSNEIEERMWENDLHVFKSKHAPRYHARRHAA